MKIFEDAIYNENSSPPLQSAPYSENVNGHLKRRLDHSRSLGNHTRTRRVPSRKRRDRLRSGHRFSSSRREISPSTYNRSRERNSRRSFERKSMSPVISPTRGINKCTTIIKNNLFSPL